MASALALAHIEAERRLRVAIGNTVERLWRDLPGYDRENVDDWLAKVAPVILAGRRQSVALTNAYLGRALGRPAVALDATQISESAVRNGADLREVYTRPFVTVWTALQNGALWDDAVEAGRARAVSMAVTDCQIAMQQTLMGVAASG